MRHVSLYRKWRPRTFDAIVGQEPVVRTLDRAIETGRVAHAYLFSGPRGTGKTSTAKVLAMGLNCAAGPTAEPDGTCDSCRAVVNNSSLDVVEMDAASNRGIDEIRDLRDRVNLAPVGGLMKVYIIDEVHMLTPEAFNALLKMLEELPELRLPPAEHRNAGDQARGDLQGRGNSGRVGGAHRDRARGPGLLPGRGGPPGPAIVFRGGRDHDGHGPRAARQRRPRGPPRDDVRPPRAPGRRRPAHRGPALERGPRPRAVRRRAPLPPQKPDAPAPRPRGSPRGRRRRGARPAGRAGKRRPRSEERR